MYVCRLLSYMILSFLFKLIPKGSLSNTSDLLEIYVSLGLLDLIFELYNVDAGKFFLVFGLYAGSVLSFGLYNVYADGIRLVSWSNTRLESFPMKNALLPQWMPWFSSRHLEYLKEIVVENSPPILSSWIMIGVSLKWTGDSYL